MLGLKDQTGAEQYYSTRNFSDGNSIKIAYHH